MEVIEGVSHAASAGSAITAEIATMRVNEQIEALHLALLGGRELRLFRSVGGDPPRRVKLAVKLPKLPIRAPLHRAHKHGCSGVDCWTSAL